MKYEPQKVEAKWQAVWSKNNLYKVDLKKDGKKYYLLVEFTYPSGDLHMGHWFAFAVPDILARMKRMQGYSVFAPNGFDAFGLPAENAAIARGVHPRDWTYANVKKMKQQFAAMGAIYDWEHEVITCDPEYYRWNQWIFLKMYEKGLAYRGKALANWCPKDQCVLANENVENGRCWRCGSEVVQKEVDQWFLRVTDYAERLIWSDHEPGSKNSSEPGSEKAEGAERSRSVDWLEALKQGQNNWIGKSEGALIKFSIFNFQFSIEVFTTRPDTLFGATFLVLAPEHPLVASLLNSKFQIPNSKLEEIKKYVEQAKRKTEQERIAQAREKTGVDTGLKAINPVKRSFASQNNEKIPIWIADYVLMAYGTGAIMAVPAHDQRDLEFAKKYDLPIKQVILRESEANREVTLKTILRSKTSLNSSKGKFSLRSNNNRNDQAAYSDSGTIINSGEWNGWRVPEEIGKVSDWLERKRIGKRQTQYHLHDWSISRQRYWGTPIPVIYCANCGEIPNSKFQIANIDGKKHAIVPVPYDQLPVELPYKVDYAPKGKPPLATAEDWVRVKCPNCGGEARREVETMDTFVDSSWYFLRYLRNINSKFQTPNSKQILNPKIKNSRIGNWKLEIGNSDEEAKPFDLGLVRKWMPVDIYFGGAEHTLGHTLYSRFFVKFLQDIGKIPPMEEYARKRVHHGVILGPDGSRMSKSHGNVVNPDEEVKKYGADSVRMYLAFLGPYDLVAPWNPGGIGGVNNFLLRTWKLFDSVDAGAKVTAQDRYEMNKTIKKVSEDVEATKFNTAVSALMQWLNYLSAKAHKLTTDNLQLTTNKEKSIVNCQLSIVEYEVFLKLLAPFAPHMCEELWQRVHSSELIVHSQKEKKSTNYELQAKRTMNWSVHQQPWPKYDPKLARAKTITLVVQVNGKVRDRLPVEAGIGQEEAEKLALESARVQKYLGKKKPRKIIFVPGRLINLVI